MSVELTITIQTDKGPLQRLSKGLANRAPMHAAIAATEEEFFKGYVSRLNRHRTAIGLGASPTSFYEKAAARIEGDHNEELALIRIPRATGLGRAFRDFNLTPKNGKKYLTIPAHRTTYGLRVAEVPHSMTFAIVGGRHKALVFTSGPDKGSAAYWLRERVTIKRDSSLLPSGEAIERVAIGAARKWLIDQMRGGAA